MIVVLRKKEKGWITMGLFKDNFTLLKKASEPLYKTPKSVQQTIEIMKISECGIFEVASGKYSKTYRFSDVNYATRTENEQESFFQRYCKCLNSFDCTFKITVNNKNKDMELLKKSERQAEDIMCLRNLMNNCDYSELSKITIKCRIKIMLFTYIFYKYMRKA